MKFSFKIQQYQTDAVDAVARVFQGQPYNAGVSYLRDIGNLPSTPQQISVTQSYEDGTQVEFQDALDDSGFKNEALQLTNEQILRNIQSIQNESNIHQSTQLVAPLESLLFGYRDGDRYRQDLRLHQNDVRVE